MDEGSRFGGRSLAAATLVVMLAQSFHALPLGAQWAGRTAAWLAVLFSGLLCLLCYWPVARYMQAHPGQNLLDIARTAAGAPGEIITATLICVLAIWHSGLIMRQTTEMAVSVVYPHTPEIFPTAALAISALYCALGGLAAVVRLCRIFLPFLILAIVAVCLGTIGWGKPDDLFPILGPGLGVLLIRSLILTAWLWPVLIILYMAPPHLRESRHLMRAGTVVVGTVSILFAILEVIMAMVVPQPLGLAIIYPLHGMARLVILGRFFERIDGLWVYCWVFATACHLGAVQHVAAAAFAKAVRLPSHQPAVIPLAVMVLTVALTPRDVYQSVHWDMGKAPEAVGIAFLLPVVLTGIAAWRNRRSAGRAV